MLDGDDRVEKPEGISVLRLSHLNILLLTGSQIIRYFLDITGPSPEDDADVVLTINNDPLLVFGEYQQGKTACFMVTAPHTGEPNSLCHGHFIPTCCGQHASIHRRRPKTMGNESYSFYKYELMYEQE